MQNTGPELPGGQIDVDMILNKANVENRATKIFCTLGPACWEVEQLEELIHAGLNTARFNFSHGDHAGHKACLDRLRQAMKNTGKQVGKFMNANRFFGENQPKRSLFPIVDSQDEISNSCRVLLLFKS